jgi:hypothetical protein
MSTGTGPVVVVGVDGSPAGNAALTWAIKEASRQQGTVHAVAVRHAPELMPATSFALEPHGLRQPDPGEAASAQRPHEWAGTDGSRHTGIVVAALFTTVVCLVRWRLDKIRYAAWEAEWSQIDPWRTRHTS